MSGPHQLPTPERAASDYDVATEGLLPSIVMLRMWSWHLDYLRLSARSLGLQSLYVGDVGRVSLFLFT